MIHSSIKNRGPKYLVYLVPLCLGAGFLLFGPIALAQGVGSFNDSVSVIVDPSNPRPEENVTIDLESSLVNLADSNIIWRTNGKVAKQGIAATEFSFKMGKVGVTTAIDISIETKNLGTVTKNLTFSPGGVEILYQAETYTPPFYKGRALPTAQSTLTLFALTNFKTPSGVTIKPSDLIFTWRKNGTVDGGNSGRGKNIYKYEVGTLSDDSPLVEVGVTSPSYSVSGNASFRSASVNPEIVFYENNPLRGVIMEKALLNTFFLNKTEATLVAYPFFFSTRAKENANFNYKWSINGEEINHPAGSLAELTIRRPSARGESSVALAIENSQRIFQVASNNLQISYGN